VAGEGLCGRGDHGGPSARLGQGPHIGAGCWWPFRAGPGAACRVAASWSLGFDNLVCWKLTALIREVLDAVIKLRKTKQNPKPN